MKEKNRIERQTEVKMVVKIIRDSENDYINNVTFRLNCF